MGTNSNQSRGNGSSNRSSQLRSNGQQSRGGKPSKNRMTAKQKAARKRRNIIIFAVEIVVILIMVGVLWLVFANGGKEGPGRVELNEESLAVNDEVKANKEMKGYWNIALFGVDAQNNNEIAKGSRSDSIMIASINLDTGDIKLVSVYRDTYLNIGTKYTKCNAAYKNGGGEQAIQMLNSNLDMNINDFITVGYEGLKNAVDDLGGVYIDVDEVELQHINNYQYDIAQVIKSDYKEVKQTGYQLLDGMQATAYCRIRYTKGDDFKRAERQREVIKALEEQAKKADLATLRKVFNDVIDHVYTSMTADDILALLPKIAEYQIVDEGGFPEESMRDTGNIGSIGSCVVPVNLESNVVWLHEFLFNETDYKVSDKVKEFSSKIEADTTPYLNSKKK